MKKNAKNEIEVHYLFLKTEISTTIHKQHSKIHSKYRPWDGRKMVNTKSLIVYFGQKFGLKCNKTNTNKVCLFRSTWN